MAKLMPIISHDVQAREVFANHLMKEDNNFIIETICEPPPNTKLTNAREHLQLLSRAEAAEEITRKAIAQAAIDRQIKSDTEAKAKQDFVELEARLRTELEQARAQSQADTQRALIEKDAQLQNQRSEFEASVQAMQNDLLQHISGNDTLKGELTATVATYETNKQNMTWRFEKLS